MDMTNVILYAIISSIVGFIITAIYQSIKLTKLHIYHVKEHIKKDIDDHCTWTFEVGPDEIFVSKKEVFEIIDNLFNYIK